MKTIVKPGVRKHPHGRGEDAYGKFATNPRKETPPRAWGRLRSRSQRGGFFRNTPTGVGKTPACYPGCTGGGKHPHGRGEDQKKDYEAGRKLETPPRAWGRPVLDTAFPDKPRNTPTGVGKTASEAYWKRQIRKHPHGRGEDHPHDTVLPLRIETPPRAWGRPCLKR